MTNRKVEFATKSALASRTPEFWKNVFKGTVVVTSVATFILAADPTIDPNTVIRIGVYMKGLDMLVLGFSRLFGVTVEGIK